MRVIFHRQGVSGDRLSQEIGYSWARWYWENPLPEKGLYWTPLRQIWFCCSASTEQVDSTAEVCCIDRITGTFMNHPVTFLDFNEACSVVFNIDTYSSYASIEQFSHFFLRYNSVATVIQWGLCESGGSGQVLQPVPADVLVWTRWQRGWDHLMRNTMLIPHLGRPSFHPVFPSTWMDMCPEQGPYVQALLLSPNITCLQLILYTQVDDFQLATSLKTSLQQLGLYAFIFRALIDKIYNSQHFLVSTQMWTREQVVWGELRPLSS